MKRIRNFKFGWFVWPSIILITIFILMALVPSIWSSFDVSELDPSNTLQKPSLEHWLGTDEYGRDIWALIVEGARDTIAIGIGSALLAGIIGIPLGLVAGYFRGKSDSIIMAIVDGVLSFPSILLAILIVSAWGSSPISLITVIALVNFPRFTMIVKSSVLSLKEREFIMAAKLSGRSDSFIMFREIFPNCTTPIIVQGTLLMAQAILIETGLSYLGLGIQPPDPSWGVMLYNAQNYMMVAPWYSIAPGMAILLVVLAINVLGDYLRDHMDVRG